jgi:hypothetical protein
MASWLSAIAAVVVSVGLGTFLNWLAGRRKEKREENSDERSEEQQDVDRLRAISNDSLAREKFAYERLAIAEKETLSLREENRALEAEYEIAKKKADLTDELQAEVASLKRTNRALDNDLKRLLKENGHGGS